MAFRWFSKIVDGVIDWFAVEEAFGEILEEDEALVMFLEPVLEPWVVDYNNIKVGDGEGNYYD